MERLIKRLTAQVIANPDVEHHNSCALAILHLEDGYGAYESPEILQAIVDILKN